MSGKLCSLTTNAGAVALAAATPKTVLQLLTTSGTNFPRALVKKWSICFDGATSTAVPVVVKLIRQSTAGTGTGVTPVAVGDSADAILSTGAYNFSAEPTSGSVLAVLEVHPQSGYTEIFPLGMEIVVPAGGRLGIVVTAPAIVNCHATIWFEE
jgi:hypothetical protein